MGLYRLRYIALSVTDYINVYPCTGIDSHHNHCASPVTGWQLDANATILCKVQSKLRADRYIIVNKTILIGASSSSKLKLESLGQIESFIFHKNQNPNLVSISVLRTEKFNTHHNFTSNYFIRHLYNN